MCFASAAHTLHGSLNQQPASRGLCIRSAASGWASALRVFLRWPRRAHALPLAIVNSHRAEYRSADPLWDVFYRDGNLHVFAREFDRLSRLGFFGRTRMPGDFKDGGSSHDIAKDKADGGFVLAVCSDAADILFVALGIAVLR